MFPTDWKVHGTKQSCSWTDPKKAIPYKSVMYGVRTLRKVTTASFAGSGGTQNKKKQKYDYRMNGTITLRNWAVAGITCLLAAACSDTDDGNRLPDGQCPMTFTAAVDGLMATRAAGKDVWTKEDQIAVSVDDGASSKTYKISDTSSGAMEPAAAGAPCYWQKNTGQRILAWYPAEGATSVDISNQSGGFANIDYLTADVTANFTTSAVTLPFKHQMAKVKYTLVKGEGISDDDIANATVCISGYQRVSFSKGIVSSTDNVNTWIQPETTDKEALVIPQDMTNKQLIRVTIDPGSAARNYYYTPTTQADGNLEAGNQYTYTVTVKKDKLEVTASTSAAWTDDVSTGDAGIATFQITAPTSVKIKAAGGGSLSGNGSGSYTLSDGNAITVTVNASGESDKFLKDLPAKGVYEIQSGNRVADNYTYTYVLKGDLFFSEPVFQEKTIPAVGNYYYFDNTWSAELWEKHCIGIVFKAGAGDGDNIDNYSGSGLTGTINGYAVALQDAPGERQPFGSGANISSFTASTTDFNGYTACQNMSQQSGFSIYTYWACYSALHYTPEAPAASSGWYLPSLGEWNALWQNYGEVQAKFAGAGGSDMKKSYGFYWSMSKKSDSDTQPALVDFGAWSDTNVFSGNIRNDYSTSYTRPILTF